MAAGDITASYAASPGFNLPEEELALIVSSRGSIQSFQANARVAVAASDWYTTASFHIPDDSLFADYPITEAVETEVLTLSFRSDDDDDDNSEVHP